MSSGAPRSGPRSITDTIRPVTKATAIGPSCLLLLLTLSCSEPTDSFRPLFNGRDLTGWVPVNTAPSTWTVEDGMLICSGKPYGELRTERMYQNFVLDLEWRHMVPEGNAGVFIWADDITARGVPFHRSIEVQVLDNAYGNTEAHTTHGDIFPIHGATMIPINGRGGDRAFPTENRSKPSPEWNHYRITGNDGKISLEVNGKLVTQGTDASPRKGYICLESEGGVVHYRNLRIQELPDTPLDPSDIAIADRGFRSLYTGIDLSGWVTDDDSGWTPNDWMLTFTGESDVGPRISTEQRFGSFAFIFDVLPRDESNVARVFLRDGAEPTAIRIDPRDPEMAEHFTDADPWNRFEGTLRDGLLSLSLNGQQLFENRELAGVPATGALTIEAAGPIDFANIYVRGLESR